jgi:O-antigen/teichoic acid export membrane protein
VKRKTAVSHQINLPDMFRYSGYTAVGLISLAVMLNMDAILVRRFFDPAQAGNYSAAVTLGKVIQFFPIAIIIILFPKAAKRQAARQNSARLLILAMLVVLLFSGGVTLLYALFPEQIVALTLGDQYEAGGRLLGFVGAAMLFLSLANVWLNYFLSTDRTHYVYLVAVGVLIQGGLMANFHAELWQLPVAMAVNGLWLTVAGGLIFIKQQMWRRSSDAPK